MSVLILKHSDGASYTSIVNEKFDLDNWVDECLDGLKLLEVVVVELRDKSSKRVRRIQ